MTKIEKILAETLPGLGYECIDCELTVQGDLRIFIDKEGGISIDDCVLVSNHLSRLFTVEDIDYNRLEVSSPGLDRVLKKEKDFVRFSGSLVKLQTRLPIGGQKKFIGRVRACENGIIYLVDRNEKEHEIELGNIEKARIKPEI